MQPGRQRQPESHHDGSKVPPPSPAVPASPSRCFKPAALLLLDGFQKELNPDAMKEVCSAKYTTLWCAQFIANGTL
jgi:hypothetical protein